MVRLAFHPYFQKVFSKIKNKNLKEKVLKQFSKIKDNPEIGKPMQHGRKGTREIYIKPFRLSYSYNEKENKVILLDLYHKDEQ